MFFLVFLEFFCFFLVSDLQKPKKSQEIFGFLSSLCQVKEKKPNIT